MRVNGDVTNTGIKFILDSRVIKVSIKTDTENYIKSPLVFRAQNSDDRKGYGDEWRFGKCLSVGTEYGQTTRYYVTKIKIVSA